MDELIKVAIGFGASWVIVTVLAFLWVKARLTKSIEHEYAQKLEKYSTDLRHQSELALKDFDAKANERHIKLTGRFEKQIEVFSKTFYNLIMVYRAHQTYTEMLNVDDAERQIRREGFQEALDQFDRDYVPNCIIIPKETRKLIHDIVGVIRRTARLSAMVDSFSKHPRPNPKTLEEMDAHLDQLQTQLPQLMDALEKQFEKILGLSAEGGGGIN